MTGRCGILWIGLGCALLAGCGGPPHVPLVAKLSAPEADARREAALALGALGAAAAPAVPELRRCIDDADTGVRQAACRALGEIGAASPEVLHDLQGALEDRELSVRLAAAFALLKLDPQGDAHVAVLTEAMRQGEGGTIVAVGSLGAQASWAVPTLTQLLHDHRPGIRRISAEALGRIGPDAAARIALEHAAAHDPDDRVRETAAAALKAAGILPVTLRARSSDAMKLAQCIPFQRLQRVERIPC